MPGAPWFQKLLVATDFSEHASRALREGVALAKVTGGEITLAHVLSNLRAAMADMSKVSRWHLVDDIEAFERQLRAGSDQKLRAQATELLGKSPGIKIETLVGTPYIELIHAVQAQGHDLVLCGTRGQAGWKRFLIGSTSDRLIRNCPCPVWVVKGEGGRPLGKVLAAVDLSPPSGRALEAAAWLAARANAQLHVLHVVDQRDVPELPEETGELELPPPLSRRQVNRAALDRVEAFLAPLDLTVPTKLHIGHGDAWKVIGTMARKLSADLLAMGTIGRHGLPGLLLGSTTERVLHTAEVSLLTVKPADFKSPVDPAFWELPQPARV